MLFKRYASPLLFLDILIENGNLVQGIDELYRQMNEEKWWEMYLATLPLNEQSYDDWRKNITNEPSQTENITKEYVETAIKKSEDILSNFNPLK